ncbi:hypothetical protein J4H72_15055 [Vibrio alginolyticus]|uniref:hypothetical protein n=1 Tax=Vibrio TaxID=662 RepID=UPI0013C2F62B|nr:MULTISPECIES: hypothetical protein [Vibrio]MBT0109037.1 hypothetical protein [Vibrio alginolyticus]MCR9673777.1 hypothetical protein [Vibrio alginolyticus]MCS0024307.1 hypothetical protein [Vibrio antiquarius]MDW1961813.1 hypothetical protein [Vibrio sp. 661]
MAREEALLLDRGAAMYGYSEVYYFCALRFVYQLTPTERMLLRQNPRGSQFNQELIKCCLMMVDGTAKVSDMRISDVNLVKLLERFSKKSLSTEIGNYIIERDNGRDITIDYDVYQLYFEDIKTDFDYQNRNMSHGTTLLNVNIPAYGVMSKLKVNDRLEMIPHSSVSLAVTFLKSKPSWILKSFDAIKFSNSEKSSALIGKFLTSDGCENRFIFSIYASHVKSNRENLDVICLIDDREYEVCIHGQEQMHAISIIDLLV